MSDEEARRREIAVATEPRQVVLTIEGAVATLRLNRPSARNAIGDEMRTLLRQYLEEISTDDAVRLLVVTGEGSAFCAGGDVRAMRDRLTAPPGSVALAGWRRQEQIFKMIQTIHDLDVVTIAAVNGPRSDSVSTSR